MEKPKKPSANVRRGRSGKISQRLKKIPAAAIVFAI
jgi:hypothetical protein